MTGVSLVQKSAKRIASVFVEYKANLANKAGRVKAQTHWKPVAKFPLVRADVEQNRLPAELTQSNILRRDFSWDIRCEAPWTHCNQLVRKFHLFPNSWVPKFPLRLYDLFHQSSRLLLAWAGAHVALCNSSGTSKYLLILANICCYSFISLLTLSIHLWLLLPRFPDPVGLMIETNDLPIITELHTDLAKSAEAKTKLLQAWLEKNRGHHL